MPAIRSLSFNERLYLAAEAMAPPFALVYLIRGEGELDTEAIRAILPALAHSFPALQLQRKGKNWHPGAHLPVVRAHLEPLPDDLDNSCYRTEWGPSLAAFDLFQDGLMVRVRHIAMDAKGLQSVIQALFALLRGEGPPEPTGFPVDSEVQDQLVPADLPRREGYAFQWGSFAGKRPSGWQTLSWAHNRPSPTSLAVAGSCLATYLGEPCRFLVPVDLRRHPEVVPAAANLSLPLYLQITQGETPTTVQARLLKGLANKRELAHDPSQKWARLLPQGLLKALLKGALVQAHRRGKFPMSGFLSDNGFFSLLDLQSPGFKATDVWALPVFVPIAPLCLVALHHEGGTRLTLQIPADVDPEPLQHALNSAFAANLPAEVPPGDTASDPLIDALRPFWTQHLPQPCTDIPPDVSFVDLGGDSLQFLTLLTQVADNYTPHRKTAFVEAALNTGGSLTLKDMAELIHASIPSNA